MSLNRRQLLFYTPASLLGLTELVAAITGKTPSLVGMIIDQVSKLKPENNEADIVRLAQEAEKQHPGVSKIDIAGCLLFAYGIKGLLEGKHIDEKLYIFLAALLYEKYANSNPEDKEKLVEEIYSSVKALGIIAGTIAVTHGFEMDLQKSYIEAKGEKPQQEDAVALLAMFSAVISPIATTVGNANIVKDMANEIADGDKDIMAWFIGHNSGRSGYLLFGDPPFVAVVDKYGFAQGVKWQATHMWPLALYSMFSSIYKVNYKLAKKSGVENPAKVALQKSYAGMKNNSKFLSEAIGQSLLNFVKYHGGATQNAKGIQFSIGEAIVELIENIARLPWDKKLSEVNEQMLEGVVAGEKGEWIRKFTSNFINVFASSVIENNPDDEIDESKRAEIVKALLNQDTKALKSIMGQAGVQMSKTFEHTLKGFFDGLEDQGGFPEREVKEGKTTIGTILGAPKTAFDNVSDLDRIKAGFGHSMADVVNVFPFQAGCVSFLLPLFEAGIHKLDALGVKPFVKEQAIFLAVMGFSMVADNYVACKIGLELLPEKPHIALIAAIEGGEISAIGNMANVTQFNLETFSLGDSLKRVHLSADNIGVAWSYAFLILNTAFFGKVPPVLEQINVHIQKSHS